MNALMVTPATTVMMIIIMSSLPTPVFLYAMMASTRTPTNLTVARLVWKAVLLALMVTPVTSVMMDMRRRRSLKTPVF